MQYMRALVESREGDPLRFVASTEGVKRDGKALRSDRWLLDNYRANPVVLWSHDYLGRTLPIGRADVQVEGDRLVADVVFDRDDEFARQVERKYRDGFLNAVSVGWEDVRRGGDLWHELLDISAVPVPADPDALIERQRRGLAEIASLFDRVLNPQARGAHPPHTTPKAPEDTAWDGPGEVAKAEGAEQLWRMHAWRDDSMDPDTKQAYKLPHHLASGEVVWRGVAAAMARLMQGATQIPDDDRKGVYIHLERHYRQFDKEPPEFRSVEELICLGPSELRGLFLEGEPEMFPELFEGHERQYRVGAVLNARNRERLEQAARLIQEVLDSATPQQGDEERAQLEILTKLRTILGGE